MDNKQKDAFLHDLYYNKNKADIQCQQDKSCVILINDNNKRIL